MAASRPSTTSTRSDDRAGGLRRWRLVLRGCTTMPDTGSVAYGTGCAGARGDWRCGSRHNHACRGRRARGTRCYVAIYYSRVWTFLNVILRVHVRTSNSPRALVQRLGAFQSVRRFHLATSKACDTARTRARARRITAAHHTHDSTHAGNGFLVARRSDLFFCAPCPRWPRTMALIRHHPSRGPSRREPRQSRV